MTNAEARKLAEMHVSERRDTQRSLTWHETADLAHWVLARLGQEDVMDAEVAAIQERHDNDGFERIERHEYLYAWEQAHTDRGKLLHKLRAVTPAPTVYALGGIKREEFLACFRLPALTVEDAEASLDEILALMSLHVRVATPAVTRETHDHIWIPFSGAWGGAEIPTHMCQVCGTTKRNRPFEGAC